jgi:hypothetical protein
MGIVCGECPGVSQPPTRWHTGPGVRLKPGDQVWYVAVTSRWPLYEVYQGKFAALVSERRPELVARLVTDQGGIDVIYPRLFVSKQLAEMEAQVLREFASQSPACTGRWV